MAKNKTTWIDYANLSSNINQSFQLGKLRKALDEITSIEYAREERRQFENEMRQLIFDTENRLTQVREYVEIAPKGVFYAISRLRIELNDLAITPSMFQNFDDKDRVQIFINLVNDIYEESKNKIQKIEAERIQSEIAISLDINNYIETNKYLTKINKEVKLDEELNRYYFIAIVLGIILAIVLTAIGVDTNIIAASFGIVALLLIGAIGNNLKNIYSETCGKAARR